ncbi:MAG: putative rane protein, partial [bacterium]|nr:putative rane protein [bacterium]
LMLTTALGAALLAAAVGVIGLGRGCSMVGRRASLLIAMVVATPLLLLAWKIGWSWRYQMMAPWPSRFGLRCLSLSLAIGCAPLLALVASRQRAHPLYATQNGAAIGAAVASMTWVLVDLWCPVADLRHLLVGHVLPCLAFIACGAIAGRRLLALR